METINRRNGNTSGMFVIGMAVLCVLPECFGAGTVVTPKRRYHGDMALTEKGVTVGKDLVRWKSIAAVMTDRTVRTTSPNAIVMKTGEIWRGTAVRLQSNKLAVRIPPYGLISIDIQMIASIEFNNAGLQRGGKKSRLYRRSGNPITGKIAGISASTVRINSALGVFNLDRGDVARFVFDIMPPPTPSVKLEDEIFLTNGSVFRCTLKPAADKILLSHGLLGNTEIAFDSVLQVRRYTEDWTHARPGLWNVAPSVDPLGSAARKTPATIKSTHLPRDQWIEELRIPATTVVALKLPKKSRGSFFTLTDLDGEYPAKLSASCDDKVVSEQVLLPGAGPKLWTFQLPAGEELQITFSFGDKIEMPSEVIMGDPMVGWK